MKDLNYRLVSNYLKGNPTYCFDLDEYTFPKYYGSVNLFNIRKVELLRRSKYALNFEQSLKTDIPKLISKSNNKYLNCIIPEFPIPIENKELWYDILNALEIDKSHFAWNTGYFKLDYLFPYFNCCIEIDSRYHFPNIKYDMARDSYLFNMYGLNTIRLLNFGSDDSNKRSNLKILKNYLSEIELSWTKCLPKKIQLDFSQSISESYIKYNYNIFKFIDLLKTKLGNKFYITKEIKIKISDYKLSFPDIMDKFFKSNVSDILKFIYKKQIKFL